MINVTVQNDDIVTRKLKAGAKAMGNLKPFWNDVFAPKYFGDVQALFAMSGQPRSQKTGQFMEGRWAPLKPAYAAWKEKFYPGRPILTRTGRLGESLNWRGTSLGRDGVWQPTERDVVFGTAVPYGRYHRDGTKHMVARPFLPTPDVSVFKPMLLQWVREKFDDEGLV